MFGHQFWTWVGFMHVGHLITNTIHKNFEGKCNLLYSDTDSLVFSIQHNGIYEWIKQKQCSSSSLSDSIRGELEGWWHQQWRRSGNSRTKCTFYSWRNSWHWSRRSIPSATKRSPSATRWKSRARRTLKGLSQVVIKKEIKHDKYANVTETNEALKKEVVSIRSFNHQLYTCKQHEIALTLFYDKMQMIDNINSIPYGYNPINKTQ